MASTTGDTTSSAATTTGTTALLISAATSAAATVFFIREFVPSSVQDSILSSFSNLLSKFSTQITVIVEETEGFSPNRMYKAAELYLATAVVPSASNARRLKVNVEYDDDEGGEDPDTEDVRAEAVHVTIDRGEEVVDFFKGVKFVWRVAIRETNRQSGYRRRRYGYMYDNGGPSELKYLELEFHKKHKDLAVKSYLPHVLQKAKSIREEAKTLKLYTNDEDTEWTPVKLRHPATFESVAMNGQKKKNLIDDLSRFLQRKEYYKKIGKAWKRGYLLYGPPGTGKSTLIAAMANFLRFDIYDLELTEVRSNAVLRSLLINTSSRSILVIEDIDCSADLQQRDEKKKPNKDENNPNDEDSKVTLSGLLNFVDGLWSSCGDERIIIFTTNYKEKLDPALLRPGRMDMHIHMGFCDSAGFRVLASNYHNIETHPLFEEIDELIERVDVTPAEIAEGLMRSDDAETALNAVISLIKEKEREVNEGKKKKESEEVGLGAKKESQEEISEEGQGVSE